MNFLSVEALVDPFTEVVTEIEKVATEANSAIRELADLELAIVGGGCGEVIFG